MVAGVKHSAGIKRHGRLCLLASTALLAPLSAVPAQTLPSGGQVIGGAASIGAPADGKLVVSQSSERAIINWNSFSVGQGGEVRFENGSGATLNRVTGGSISTIDGLLSASGSVFLLNPNGIIIGKDGVVDVGGSFIGTSLDLPNHDFMAGKDLVLSGKSTASVINLGKVGALGGDVVLAALHVANHGSINSPQGSTGLLGGTQILLADRAEDGGRFKILFGGSAESVTNTGTIHAAAAELRANGGSIYALAGNTRGIIKATGVRNEGGRVFLTAGNGGSIDVAGSDVHAVDGTGAGGSVVIGSAHTGRTSIGNGARISTGAGGFIETSAADLRIGTATVTAGPGGHWLLDPYDLTVDTTAASTIVTSLDSGSRVTLQTTASSASGPGSQNSSGSGDIIITAPIVWSGDGILALDAYRNVRINSDITAGGTNAGLEMTVGAGGDYLIAGGRVTLTGSNASLVINGQAYTLIRTAGDLQSMPISGYFAVTNDIDASGVANFDPVGDELTPFEGTFAGLGHVVSGLNISRSSDNNVGLFGVTNANSVLRDITISGGSITGASSVGALAGKTSGLVRNSHSTTTVNGTTHVGGLVGWAQSSSEVHGSTSAASVTATGLYAGGLIGYNEGGVTSSFATGNVTGTTSVGGLIGQHNGSLTDGFAMGAVRGNISVGGLIGAENGSQVTSVFASGAVSGTSATGGLIGSSTAGTITNAYWDKDTTGQSASAGIAASYGLATADLQSTLPGGFDPAVWGISTNLYPYLSSFYNGTPQAISGFARRADGSAIASGSSGAAAVGVTIGGALAGTSATGANGYYYRILAPASVSNGTRVMAGLTGSAIKANAYTDVTTGTVTGLNLTEATLSANTGSNALADLMSRIDGASAGFASSDRVYDGSALQSGTNFGIVASGAFSIDRSLALGSGMLDLSASGNLTFNSGSQISGSILAVKSGGLFINNAGAGALSATNRWLVYLASASGGHTYGNLNSNNTAIWGTNSSSSVAASGNRYVFAESAGTLTFTPANATKTYGNTHTFQTQEGTNFTVTGYRTNAAGAYLADTASSAWTGTPVLTSAGASATANAGNYTISLSGVTGQNGYAVNLNATGTLTVTPRTIAVTASNASRYYGDADPAFSYVITGMGLANGDTLTGSLASNASQYSNAGNYRVDQGTLAAGPNYSMTFYSGAFTINKRPVTVAANNLSRYYGDANPALTYTVGGSGLVNGDSLTGSLATTATTASSVGNYNITQGTVAGGINYAVTFTGGTLAVTQRPLTITANNLSRVYGDANPALTYTVGGSGLTNGDSLTGSLVTAADTTSSVGDYSIGQGTLSASSNYAVTFNSGLLTITPRSISITANDTTRIYGNANPAFTYSIGGAGLANGDTLTGNLATSADTTSGIGAYGITQGTVSAGTNYTVSFTPGTLTITPRPITISVPAGLTKIYGETDPLDPYTISGDLVNGDMLAGALSRAPGEDVGSYAYSLGTLTAGSNYAITFLGNSLAVAARPITVTADDLSRYYGEANPALSWTVGGMGLINGDSLSGSLATTAGILSGVGTYTVAQGTLAASSNYALTFNSGSITVSPRPITVTAENLSRIYGEANPAFSYTVGGMGLINGDNLTGTLATPAGNLSPVGHYAISQGSLSATPNYDLTFESGTLSVTPRPVIINIGTVTSFYGDTISLAHTVGGMGWAPGESVSLSLLTGADERAPVGSYSVQAQLKNETASRNYLLHTEGSITVIPRPITVLANNLSRAVAAPNPDLTFTVGGMGLVNGDTLSGNLSTSAERLSVPGDYAITQGTLAASANYQLTFIPGSLRITGLSDPQPGPQEPGQPNEPGQPGQPDQPVQSDRPLPVERNEAITAPAPNGLPMPSGRAPADVSPATPASAPTAAGRPQVAQPPADCEQSSCLLPPPANRTYGSRIRVVSAN